MRNPEVIAIIPARSGSKGVPDKNVFPLAGHPLLAYSIAAARLSGIIDRVLVSTDSRRYADVARDYGAEAPFLRPAEFAGDRSPDRDCILHAMRWIEEHEGRLPEHWVHLRPTTPLRDPALVDAAIAAILANPEATSLRSGHPAAESPFKWFERDGQGYFRGLRPDDPRPEYYNLPRQAFPPVYVPDGYVDVLRASFVTTAESLHGPRMMGFVSPVCQEVDRREDLELIEYRLEKSGSPLLDFLQTHHRKG